MFFRFSYITQASFSEFVLDGHFTSPNQQDEPPTISIRHSEPLPSDASPSEVRGRVWALQHFPYLPFLLYSPFQGAMTSRFATPPEEIALEEDGYGFHLPDALAKSWKTFEESCCQALTVLRSLFQLDHPKTPLHCSEPLRPSKFGYMKGYPKETKARLALSASIDAFVLLFAYVSFMIAMCRAPDDPISVPLSSSTKPRWFKVLSERNSRIHPEWLQLLAESPISDFSTTQRVGVIMNVSQCQWINLVPRMIKVNIPIWFYWGTPPAFLQPLEGGALFYAPRSHPQTRAPPLPVSTQSQSVGLPTQSQSVSLPARSTHGGPSQLPGESWKDFMARQNIRREKKISRENDVERQARQDRENKAAKKSCPGKKGPTVFVWEEDNGIWTRSHVTRALVEGYWSRYSSSQMIYNSIDNCWDLCKEFNIGHAGEMDEYDFNDSDEETHRPKQSRTPQPVQKPTQLEIPSDCTPMDVERAPSPISPDPSLMLVDEGPAQISSNPSPLLVPLVPPTPTQATSDCPPMNVDPCDSASLPPSMSLEQPNPQSEPNFIDDDDNDEDPYESSRKDVLNAYSFGPLDLEEMPVTTLDDLLYYRYGYSLNESPYTGIPTSVAKVKGTFRSWTEVHRAVGGQHLDSSETAEYRRPIKDFLTILVESDVPLHDVPGKYWDLSSSGFKPIVELDKVFISIEERQFNNGKHYIIVPRFLHPSRDTSWFLSVDPMTALECIRRGLGPHTVDIANFLISHGVRFRTLERLQNSPKSLTPSVRPHCRYLGYRPVGHSFDLADFAGYEALRDGFLGSQAHGPFALRSGGIIARLAREVLPNSNALSGPSYEALNGGREQFICDGEIYVDDSLSVDDLGLICGTYVLSDGANPRGNKFSFPSTKLLLI